MFDNARTSASWVAMLIRAVTHIDHVEN